MKIDFSSLSYDAKWYEFGDARLKIRPYPSSMANLTLRQKGLVLEGEQQCEIFKYCLLEWENVTSADGKPLKLTEEVKQKVFDFRMAGIPEFVLAKSRQFEEEKEAAEKN